MVKIPIKASVEELFALALALPKAKLLYAWDSAYAILTLSPTASISTVDVNNKNVFDVLDEKVKTSFKPDESALDSPPFVAGWLGHISYEFAQNLESTLALPEPTSKLPVFCFDYYESCCAIHLDSGEASVFSFDDVAAQKMKSLITSHIESIPKGKPIHSLKLRQGPKQGYIDAVKAIKQAIRDGDYFQTNLTRKLVVEASQAEFKDLLHFALKFIHESEAPMGAIIHERNQVIISASPERFFAARKTADQIRIIAEPIKGTRPRKADPREDQKMKDDLLNSDKDRAENIMIADLVRNDLSRVCRDESIKAEQICALKSFKHVHHLVTTITGILRSGLSTVDALKVQFPCGSITGAPKWAAMDHVAQLEGKPREIYCGTIGFFDNRGSSDFSVTIRTVQAEIQADNLSLTYGAGGGITLLSHPEDEYIEAQDKAAGFIKALGL